MVYLFVFIFLLFFYILTTKNHRYWSKRNVKHETPVPLFGNNFVNNFGLKNVTEISTELYNKDPGEKVVGYYRGTTLELIIRDLNIARQILIVDFAYFYPRGVGRNSDVEVIFTNLFQSDGDYWRLLRQRLTLAFTTAKLKAMFPLVVQCAEKLQTLAEQTATQEGLCDVRELMAWFTIEFIGACGFGIQMDTINDKHSLFIKLGKIITTRKLKHIVLFMLWELFPPLRKFLYVGERKIENGIKEILEGVRRKRNYKPSGRNDFIDLLLELEAKGTIKGESIEYRNPDGSPHLIEMEIDLRCRIGQVFVFFAAGFETSSTATSYTLHELSYNLGIHREIQEEIDTVLAKYDNKLCYDSIAEMTLLSMAFKEAMRKFPSIGVLHRVCAKRYTIPELDITIDPGVKIVIPIAAIQNDEQYFNDPKEFRPQRFAEDLGKHKYSYLPFGEGPRSCIGVRLGEMQSLAGLAAILQKFTVVPAPTSRRNVEVNHALNVVNSIKGGLPVILKLRKEKTT